MDATKDNNRIGVLNSVMSNEKEKDITEYPEAECLLNHINKKLRKKMDWKCLFSGGTGTGKSESGARLLELHYKQRFNEEMPLNHIVSDLGKAIMIIKNFKRKGEGLLIEEISTSVGSRDSQTTQNKLWNKILDTMRIKQVVLIMNAPHISFVDKHIRMSLDAWCDCKSIDFNKNICLARPLWLQTSPHKADPYKHKYVNDDGGKIEWCYFNKCSEYIITHYKETKYKFTEEIYEEIHMRMTKDRVDKLKKFGQKFLTKRECEAYMLYLNGYDLKEGAKKMKLGSLNSYRKLLGIAKGKLQTDEYKKQLQILENEEKAKAISKKVPIIRVRAY